MADNARRTIHRESRWVCTSRRTQAPVSSVNVAIIGQSVDSDKCTRGKPPFTKRTTRLRLSITPFFATYAVRNAYGHDMPSRGATTSITATDLFCGAGGSSLGAVTAGLTLEVAANHWSKAVEVHQANFPNTRHDCADVSQVDFHRYPSSDVLIASPECTNHSSSKGVSRKRQQVGLWDTPDPAAERSRATMWDVHRYIEVHRPSVVVVENVVEAHSWIYWSAWWQAFCDAGYIPQTLSLNSMHIPGGSLGSQVPQSRDRLYVVAARKGISLDLELRPEAYCQQCETVTTARQHFKSPSRTFGRYRQSWVWLCRVCSATVEPPTAPASQAIDWSIPSQRIGDRSKPLAESTLMRIRNGFERYGIIEGNFIETMRSHQHSTPVSEPLSTVVASSKHHALVNVVETAHSGTRQSRSVHEPFRTMVASDDRPLLVDPPKSFYLRNFGDGSKEAGNMLHPTTVPLGAITAHDHTSLLVPYYSNGQAQKVSEPIGTLTTHDQYDLASAIDIDDCTFRMLEPHEVGRAMGFPDTYQVDGTKKDRVRLYGNAVTPPVMEFIVGRVVSALKVA